MAETGFSYRLTAYKIVGHLLGLSYLHISGNNQVENIFFRISNISVLCPHAQLRAQSLKSYGHFSDLWVVIALSHRHVEFYQVKQIHQSTVLESTTRPTPMFVLCPGTSCTSLLGPLYMPEARLVRV